jgi:mannose/cellobiose epimerase-like protein (N-acyl-D-glucosamine 2-epimerase family)
MKSKKVDRCLKLLSIMSDARRKQTGAFYEALKSEAGSITGDRRYAIYKRQVDRYASAVAELTTLILEDCE